MLNDLDMVSILDNSSTNGLWSNTSLPTTSSVSSTSTGHPVSTHSGLHPTSYASFSNSYLEDLNGSASVMVNPNNVMPLHHPLQHQQVTSLSVNTRYRMPHHICQSLVAFSNILNSWPKFISPHFRCDLFKPFFFFISIYNTVFFKAFFLDLIIVFLFSSLNPHSPQQNSPQSPMPSPMFGNQHQQQQVRVFKT